MNEKKTIFILLCLGCFTISFNVAAIAAALPTISLDLLLSDWVAARIVPAYMIPYGLGALLYAPLVRRLSFRTVLSYSMGLYGVACFLCASVYTINYLVMGRILMGISGASAIPLGLILIGKIFPKHVRGRRVGVFFGCSFVASILGILLSGTAHWRWLFYLPAIMGTLTAVSVHYSRSDVLNKTEKGQVNYIRTLKIMPIRKVFIYITLISMLYHGVHKWFGIYLCRVYELSQMTISGLFILMALGGLFGQVAGGYLTDLKGRLESCRLGIVMLGVGTIFLCGVFPLWMLTLILISISMGWTIGHNGISTVLTDFPDENRSEIASLNSSLRFIGGGMGFLITSMYIHKSFSGTFLIIGILLFALTGVLKRIIPDGTHCTTSKEGLNG